MKAKPATVIPLLPSEDHTWEVAARDGGTNTVRARTATEALTLRRAAYLHAIAQRGEVYHVTRHGPGLPLRVRHSPVCACRVRVSLDDLYPPA